MGIVITLRDVFCDYQKSRSLKPKTLQNYNHRLNHCFADWLDVDIRSITKDDVERRHRSISGYSMANSAMKTLKSLLNYAMVKYEKSDGTSYLQVNPVIRLSQVKAWNRDKRRKTLIRPRQLSPWFEAVFSLASVTSRDFLVFTVLTGMRLNEARLLTWNAVDFNKQLVTLSDTKNGDSRVIPLGGYALNLLKMRRIHFRSVFVFGSQDGSRPLSNSVLNAALKLVVQRSGVKFCVHDLRRTYITMGDELEQPVEVVKQLVGHRNRSMTESYIIRSVERLRETTEKINQEILKHLPTEYLEFVKVL